MRNFFPKGIKFFLLFFSISNFQMVYPFEEVWAIDIRALSLGQVCALSEVLNPAYLPFSEQKQVGASVYNRFQMKELSTKSVFGTIPNRFIDAGFHLSVFGYEAYQQIQIQVGPAKKLSNKLAVGVAFSYRNENLILEEKNQSFLLADASVFWRINDSFEGAFVTQNLLHTRNRQQTFCFAGINYRPFSGARVLLESGFDFQKQWNLSAGLEYEIAGQFIVRGGFRNNPQMPSLGFAYFGLHWKVETAFLLHSVLGLSSGIGISYLF